MSAAVRFLSEPESDMAEPQEKIVPDNSSGEYEGKTDAEHDARNHSMAYSRKASVNAADRARRNLNAKLANPLAGYSHTELEEMGAAYATKYQLGDESDIRAFRMGAILAQDPARYEQCRGLEQDEVEILRKEFTNRWSQPKLMYVVIVLCSTCAAVQGMGMSSCHRPVRTATDMGTRRGCRQWRAALLQRPIRHWWQGSSVYLALRARQFRTLPLLCTYRLLADHSVQSLVWPSWYYLYHLHLLGFDLLLAGFRQHLVAHVHCSILPWLRYRA